MKNLKKFLIEVAKVAFYTFYLAFVIIPIFCIIGFSYVLGIIVGNIIQVFKDGLEDHEEKLEQIFDVIPSKQD